MSLVLMQERNADAGDVARALLPPCFELVIAHPRSGEFREALAEARYLIAWPSPHQDDDFYRSAPKLKLMQLMSVGYDGLDLDAAQRAGVLIATNGGANAGAVAEHTLMLMLAASRRVVAQHNATVSGHWQVDGGTPDYRELAGTTLGLVGMGTIARKVARLATAFGMAVRYYSRTPLSPEVEDETGSRFMLLPELLQCADVVSLHVPLTPQTRGSIGARELGWMKPGAIFINTARGELVDEAALYQALLTRRLFAAGLDVFATEPLPGDSPLLTLDNVVLTPHRAGVGKQNLPARFRNFYLNFERVERGERPLWVISEPQRTIS